MSATNAISGISLIGSLVVAGSLDTPLSTLLGFLAVTCSATNVVGGFLITDRMLKMFKSERQAAGPRRRFPLLLAAPLVLLVLLGGLLGVLEWTGQLHNIDAKHVLTYLYILSAVLFILGLKGLSSPKWARQGMFLAEFGMLAAVVGTLFHPSIVPWGYAVIGVGLLIGALAGGTMGLRIPMTAVPQRTALSHSLGALAAALIGVAEYAQHHEALGSVPMTPLGFEVVIGGLTFTGSLM